MFVRRKQKRLVNLDNNAGAAVRHAIARPASLVAAVLAALALAVAATPASAEQAWGGAFGAPVVKVASVRMSARWKEIVAERPELLFSGACGEAAACDDPLVQKWRALRARQATGLVSEADAIQAVNAMVNQGVRFAEDDRLYGVADYWASPAETLRKGAGDCEDLAILKWAMLVALGLDPEGLRLDIGVDTNRRQGHAVLVADADGARLVLDNLADAVRPDTERKGFQPLYALGVNGAWLHGAVRRQDKIAAF